MTDTILPIRIRKECNKSANAPVIDQALERDRFLVELFRDPITPPQLPIA